MTEIEGLGSMSAMLLIISIIAIGSVMAVKNKIVNKRLRRSQVTDTTSETNAEVSTHSKLEPVGADESTSDPTKTADVDKLLDSLRKDVED
tara:strand:+ start:1496 stop:1768 length:273 start_codon:yes stop_codon:yes gene_type:complete